ncbi:hypothetical protein BKA66DRAFT_465589 [Pyrenochaeta sp. MPI-SDFR-AT-0127]|nr:hypothetical protein BKA66DRAFT_465589 [Pyrenochaeta sp. MPI-SDFR-AT-0127]
MSILRPMSIRRSAALRPAALSAAPRAHFQVRFASQDYGSGDGNPAGEKPQQQGKNPSENIEHPGPPPPKVAQGQSSSSPNEDGSSSANNSTQKGSQSSSTSNKNSSSSGKREFSTSTRVQSKEPAVSQAQQNKPKPSEVEGAKPKILNENPPSGEEQSHDVKKHNKEMSNRAEQAHAKVSNEDAEKDKVSDRFWKGDGGVKG